MLVLLGALALTGALVIGRSYGWRDAGAVAFLTSIGLLPNTLFGPIGYHPGIAGSTPAVKTFLLVLACIALTCRRAKGTSAIGWLVAPFLVLLLIGPFTLWEGRTEQWAGVVCLLGGALAWVAGAALGGHARGGPASGRLLATTITAIVVAQLAISLLASGPALLLNVIHGQSALRAEGTLGHAGDLGKILVLLVALLLPLTRSTDRTTRRTAGTGVGLAFLLLFLTLARANILAGFSLLAVWSVLAPEQRSVTRRLRLPVFVAVLALPFLGALVARWQSDPDGGSRPELLQAAYRQIASSPFVGTGPNSYVSVVGQWDPFTAFGLPVHNTFLLAVAELGLPLAALLLVPVVIVTARAWPARRRDAGACREQAVVLLALAPAVLIIGLTGWGLLKSGVLPLWFFVTAFTFAQMRPAQMLKSADDGDVTMRSGSVGALAIPLHEDGRQDPSRAASVRTGQRTERPARPARHAGRLHAADQPVQAAPTSRRRAARATQDTGMR